MTLADLEVDTDRFITSVKGGNQTLLMEMGFIPNAIIKVLGKHKNLMRVRICDIRIALHRSLAKDIYVSECL